MGDDEKQVEQVEQVEQTNDKQEQTKKPAKKSDTKSDKQPTEQAEQAEQEQQVKELYDELGIEANVPTAKSVGRPKSTKVRAEDDKKQDPASAKSKSRQEADKDEDKSGDASDSDSDGDSGDETDEKGEEKQSDAKEVREQSDETGKGVHEDKSETEEDSERGSKETGESDGKRPGKSNPEIEKRFQRFTSDIKERDGRIEELESKLEQIVSEGRQRQVDAEDPKYTLEDFSRVQDEYGEVIDLDRDQAELAYRRWKEGYDQRSAERQAAQQQEQAQQQQQQEYVQRAMKQSTEAYDALAGLADKFPELDEGSSEYDEQFSKQVLPLIEQSIIYAQGTEPGNAEGKKPVIMGLSMNPGAILDTVRKIKNARPNLRLDGANDSVDNNSGYQVSHSRSSDPVVNQANDLYKELGIEKRI